jgi:hypothetical protein
VNIPKLPYFSIDNARVVYTRALSIQKRSKFVKNQHARYILKNIRGAGYLSRALSIQKRSKFVKNEHARYTLKNLRGARYLSRALSIQKRSKFVKKINMRGIH